MLLVLIFLLTVLLDRFQSLHVLHYCVRCVLEEEKSNRDTSKCYTSLPVYLVVSPNSKAKYLCHRVTPTRTQPHTDTLVA
jgi:hypothetical protein